MGHYASEMMCNSCGQCRCTCPPKPDLRLDKWVVDLDHTVLTARAFDAKHGYRTFFGHRIRDESVGPSWRMCKEHFDTKEEAQAHALDLLNASIKKSEEQAAELRTRRNMLYPAA
jgi:hypothetical protein